MEGMFLETIEVSEKLANTTSSTDILQCALICLFGV